MQENEVILRKNKIVFVEPETVDDPRTLRYELATLLNQKPNDKAFIFFRPRLWLYYRQQEKGDTTDFDRFIENKLVEPPTLYDTTLTELTVEYFKEHLFNRGYLRPHVWAEDTIIRQKAFVTYFIKPNKLYRISSLELTSPDSTVNKLINDAKSNTFLKPGNPVSNALFYNEKQRIVSDLHQRGFSNLSLGNFSPLEVSDTTDGQVATRLRLLPSVEGSFSQKYVGQVRVFNRFEDSDFVIRSPLMLDSIMFLNFNTKNKIDPNSILPYISLRPGKLFNKQDVTLTRTRLQLPAIQFVDITASPRGDSSNIVDFQIDLLPNKRINTNAKVELNQTTVSSNSFIGVGGNLGLVNNNFLGSSERLSNTLDASVEINPVSVEGFFNAANLNFSNRLEIPRYSDYLTLHKGLNKLGILSDHIHQNISGRTTSFIDINYEYIDLFRFFNYHSLTLQYGYRNITPSATGREQIEIIHPSLTYFDPTVRDQFNEFYTSYTYARMSFEPQLMSSLLFNRFIYTKERYQGPRGFSTAFIGSFELSGLEAFLGNLLINGGRNAIRIGSLEFAQFARLELDARVYKQLAGEQALAFRGNLGLAAPFGTSEILPYVRQFDLGGPLSMRAWRIRELGPGAFQDTLITRELNTAFLQKGDIKILLNAEYRFDIFWRIEGAVFVDAGNIWTIKPDDRTGGVFSTKFLNQIAIGSGAGMRFDADYFKVVIDMGLKLRNPFPDENGAHYAIQSDLPLRDIVNFNFSINYPF